MLYSAKFLSSATCYIQIKVCDLCFPPQLLKIAMKPKSPSQRQFYTQTLTFTLEPPLPSAIPPCVCTVDMSVWSALQFFHILALKSTLNCFANLWQFDVANVSSLWHHTREIRFTGPTSSNHFTLQSGHKDGKNVFFLLFIYFMEELNVLSHHYPVNENLFFSINQVATVIAFFWENSKLLFLQFCYFLFLKGNCCW